MIYKKIHMLTTFSLLFSACIACTGHQASNDNAATAQKAETELAQQTTLPARTLDDVEYAAADSAEVVKLVGDNEHHSTLDFARYFLDRPYVAYTLDGYYKDGTAKGDAEHLIVNLREFDCLTLLETCNALVMTKAAIAADAEAKPNAGKVFGMYCTALEKLRYFGGKEDGYLSRIHYLSMSIDDHLKRGTMQEVDLPEKYTKPRTTTVNYMTKHAQSYFALKANPDLVAPLAELEKKYSGQQMRFLPQENCGLSQQELSAIHDGDILYIVTSKEGLDYAHQGYAFWGKDGKLHMLHASSAKKKVLEDPLTLEAYLKGIPSSIGVRVFRLN